MAPARRRSHRGAALRRAGRDRAAALRFPTRDVAQIMIDGEPRAKVCAMHPALQARVAKRTTVQLQLFQDPWPMIFGWGQHHKYTPVGTPQEGLVLFQRGWGSVKAHNVAFNVEGNVLTIQAWIAFTTMERLRSLFILPDEIDVGSGARGVIARRKVRGELNELLGHLHAPPIQ